MKRFIATADGLKEVEQIGNVREICGEKFFKHENCPINRITHLKTGMAVLTFNGTFSEAEIAIRALPPGKLENYISSGKKSLKKYGIEYPVNKE